MELITGNKFKKICNYSLDEFGFNVLNEPKENEIVKIFVKIDFVPMFFSTRQQRPYVLYTHNGDLPVDDGYLKYLDDPNLIKWYGQNIMTTHPKLKSIPIGIANEIWPHGNEDVFKEVMGKNIEKKRLIYVNFDVNTNRDERNHCILELNKKGLEMQTKLPFKEYLEEVAKSYFVVSPNGNGVDCHKTWEALHLKTIPIVTQSINIEYYKNLPIIVLENWSYFNPHIFDINLYQEKMGGFDRHQLSFNKFIK